MRHTGVWYMGTLGLMRPLGSQASNRAGLAEWRPKRARLSQKKQAWDHRRRSRRAAGRQGDGDREAGLVGLGDASSCVWYLYISGHCFGGDRLLCPTSRLDPLTDRPGSKQGVFHIPFSPTANEARDHQPAGASNPIVRQIWLQIKPSSDTSAMKG